jgi:hypothetical protein
MSAVDAARRKSHLATMPNVGTALPLGTNETPMSKSTAARSTQSERLNTLE